MSRGGEGLRSGRGETCPPGAGASGTQSREYSLDSFLQGSEAGAGGRALPLDDGTRERNRFLERKEKRERTRIGVGKTPETKRHGQVSG